MKSFLFIKRHKIVVGLILILFAACGKYPSDTLDTTENALRLENSNDTLEDVESAKGLFVLNISVNLDKMCQPNERIICNAFVRNIVEKNLTNSTDSTDNNNDINDQKMLLQPLPNLLGQIFVCPDYRSVTNLANTTEEKCDLNKKYTGEVHCLNVNTQESWVASEGTFEITCIAQENQ